MDRQTDQGPPPLTLVLLLVPSSTIESKVLIDPEKDRWSNQGK